MVNGDLIWSAILLTIVNQQVTGRAQIPIFQTIPTHLFIRSIVQVKTLPVLQISQWKMLMLLKKTYLNKSVATWHHSLDSILIKQWPIALRLGLVNCGKKMEIGSNLMSTQSCLTTTPLILQFVIAIGFTNQSDERISPLVKALDMIKLEVYGSLIQNLVNVKGIRK
jgi:hypothetical protein